MKKWIRIGGYTAAAVAIGAGVLVLAGLALADARMQRTIDVTVRPVPITDDASSLQRGRYLFRSRGCIDCHGEDGAGRTFVEGPDLRIHGANLTTGPGSAVAQYRPEDWVRSIRHGVAPSGRPLRVMPSEDYNRLTDADLGALIAYVRSLPPAPGAPTEVRLPLPARVLYGLGAIPDAASKIDHDLPPAEPVPEGVTVAHGAYVANMCLGCHGPALSGGRIPGSPPDWPPAPRLAPGDGSVMANYAEAESLMQLFRSGKRADGSAVRVMPFESLGHINETDVRALHLYLRSLKPS
ncbi:MAG TPA: cytochrome c [Zeimonas sp.]